MEGGPRQGHIQQLQRAQAPQLENMLPFGFLFQHKQLWNFLYLWSVVIFATVTDYLFSKKAHP